MAITSPSQCHAEFAAAFNAGDLDALCDMYEPDAVFVPEPGANAVQGIDTIRSALAGYLAIKPRIEIETVFVHENGDIALLRARWKLAAADPEGNLVEMNGSSSEVIRRQPDGAWRQVIDHPFGAS